MRGAEELLLEADALGQRVKEGVLAHIGRAVALFAIAIATIFIFTEIAFVGVTPAEFTLEASVMLISGLVMYFSLESEGQGYAKMQASFSEQKARSDALAGEVKGEMLPALRSYLCRIHEEEMRAREDRLLLCYGIDREEYESYRRGGTYGKKRSRYLKRVARITAAPLTPSELLFFEEGKVLGFTERPSALARFRGICKIIPGILCTMLTVGVMIEVKEGFSLSLLIEGALKLCALLSMGLRGYLAGVSYVNTALLPFHKVREKLLDAFLRQSTCEK